MPHGIFETEGRYGLFRTDLAGHPLGAPVAWRASEAKARALLGRLEAARTADFDLPRDLVAHACPDCARKMAERGWQTLRVRGGQIEGKGAAGELLQGLCETFAPPGAMPYSVSVSLWGGLDEDTWDDFELWLYHSCSRPADEEAAPLVILADPPGRTRTGYEYKAVPQMGIKAASEDERTVQQVFAVFGHVDSAGDRIQLGATKKTIRERKDRIRTLWQHDFDAPPIGALLDLTEKTIDELPADIAAFYREGFPDATGVLLGEVRYLDTPRGNEVLAGIQAGAITENSIGFSTVNGKVAYKAEDGRRIRELLEIVLWDVSPVNWGANDATRNVKQIGPLQYDDDELVTAVRAVAPLLEVFGSGRALPAARADELRPVLKALQTVIATAEPPPADPAAQALTDRVLRRLRTTEAGLAVLRIGG